MGGHARRNWMKFTNDLVDQSFPLHSLFERKKSRGDEHFLIPRNGSDWAPHPPTEDSLHGEQGDFNVIDEAWVFDEAEGAALMQAITPTQSTRPGAQVILVSTRGTAASTWFHDQVAEARLGKEGVAILDWGIGPDDDASDIEVVAAAHPAVGFTQSVESLEAAWKKMGGKVNEFARAYGNRETQTRDRLIPIEAWEMASTDELIPADAQVAFGVAVSSDRNSAVIFAAGMLTCGDDPVPIIELVDARPGWRWVVGRVQELMDTHGADVWVDPIGPADALCAELERKGIAVKRVTFRLLAAGCGDFLTRLLNVDDDGMFAPEIRIRPDGALDAAADIAARRRAGDSWVWDRRSPVGSIAPLEAATLAMVGAQNFRETTAPEIY